MKQTGAVGQRGKQMQILKEKIVRYVTNGTIVKGYDAGELIRCKDCQHYEAQSGYFWGTCGVNAHDVDKTDWCCWAERKEE